MSENLIKIWETIKDRKTISLDEISMLKVLTVYDAFDVFEKILEYF